MNVLQSMALGDSGDSRLGEAPNPYVAVNPLPTIDMRRRKRRAYCKMTPQDKVEVLLKRLRKLERKSLTGRAVLH